MMFDVYFRIGAVCCGPFPSFAVDDASAMMQASTLKDELGLPQGTLVMLSPAGVPPAWQYKNGVEYIHFHECPLMTAMVQSAPGSITYSRDDRALRASNRSCSDLG